MTNSTETAEGSAEAEPALQHLVVTDINGEPYHLHPLPGSFNTTMLPEQRVYGEERKPNPKNIGELTVHAVDAA